MNNRAIKNAAKIIVLDVIEGVLVSWFDDDGPGEDFTEEHSVDVSRQVLAEVEKIYTRLEKLFKPKI